MPYEDLWPWLSGLQGCPVVVDVEHSGYPIGHPHYRLRTIQLGTPDWAVLLNAGSAEHRILAGLVLQLASEVIAHSEAADLVPLEVAGITGGELWAKATDTATVAALAPPEYRDRTDDALGLKQLTERNVPDPLAPAADKARAERFRQGCGKQTKGVTCPVCGIEHRTRPWLTNPTPLTEPERNGWAMVPDDDPVMVAYACSDVLDTGRLASTLPALAGPLLARERRVAELCARVTRRGLPLDRDHLAARHAANGERLDQLAALLATFGVTEPGSPAKVGQALLELGADLPLTKTGKPSTARDVLDGLIPGTPPEQDTVLMRVCRIMGMWRDADKLRAAFLEPWTVQAEHGDGRLRPTIYTAGAAATGRMSCARPNLQQVPRTGGIRGCLTADPGHVFVSADFSSVEVRVAAALSQDQTLMRMLADGTDLHAMVAERWRGPAWTKADRYVAKRAVFGRLYGSGVAGIARTLGIPHADAQAIVDALDQITPGLTAWSADQNLGVKRRTRLWLDLPSGRRIHFDPDRGYAAGNYQIQGTARELLVDALLAWGGGPWGDCTVLPVHDELVCMVPEGDAEQATRFLVDCMTSTLHGVQIEAEASAPSHRWADST